MFALRESQCYDHWTGPLWRICKLKSKAWLPQWDWLSATDSMNWYLIEKWSFSMNQFIINQLVYWYWTWR
jgi:hypothetical protein